MPARLRALLSLLVVPTLLLATGCTDSEGGTDDPAAETAPETPAGADDPQDDSAVSPAATGELTGVTVSGPPDEEPRVRVEEGYSVGETTVQVLDEGSGPEAADGDQVVTDIYLVNGRSGTVIDSSYDRKQPLRFQLQSVGILPGLYAGLLGQSAGSRIALAIPPSAGFGAQGSPQFGVQPADTLVAVMDIEEVTEVPERAEGEVRAAPGDLPVLEVDKDGTPQRFVAEGDEPQSVKDLVVAPVIVGDGPKVRPGQTLTVQFLGQVYPDGEIFDQSWTKGQPFGFQVGTGSVIIGWDQGLVGQRVGSRVVLAVPSDLAYGEQGGPPSVGPDTDLIFVIDILSAG